MMLFWLPPRHETLNDAVDRVGREQFGDEWVGHLLTRWRSLDKALGPLRKYYEKLQSESKFESEPLGLSSLARLYSPLGQTPQPRPRQANSLLATLAYGSNDKTRQLADLDNLLNAEMIDAVHQVRYDHMANTVRMAQNMLADRLWAGSATLLKLEPARDPVPVPSALLINAAVQSALFEFPPRTDHEWLVLWPQHKTSDTEQEALGPPTDHKEAPSAQPEDLSDEALEIKHNIEMIMAAARRIWPAGKRAEISYDSMVTRLREENNIKKLRYKPPTIKKILMGTYEPAVKRNIPHGI